MWLCKRKKIEFIGNKPVTEYENLPYYEKCYTESETGTVFKIKEKKRLNWILKNLDKSDFGITEFIENENKKVVSKKKNIKSFFNKNMSNLEGKDYDLLLKKYLLIYYYQYLHYLNHDYYYYLKIMTDHLMPF